MNVNVYVINVINIFVRPKAPPHFTASFTSSVNTKENIGNVFCVFLK